MSSRARRSCLIAFVSALCLGCTGEGSQLSKAARFVSKQSTESYLRTKDGVFLSMEGEHRPSDWVDYFFSVYSTRNWVTEGTEEARYALGAPVKPAGVSLLAHTVDPSHSGPQLVVSADDERSVIVVVGYEDPTKEPVMRKEWEFPRFE